MNKTTDTYSFTVNGVYIQCMTDKYGESWYVARDIAKYLHKTNVHYMVGLTKPDNVNLHMFPTSSRMLKALNAQGVRDILNHWKITDVDLIQIINQKDEEHSIKRHIENRKENFPSLDAVPVEPAYPYPAVRTKPTGIEKELIILNRRMKKIASLLERMV